jgi:hypothetical protein
MMRAGFFLGQISDYNYHMSRTYCVAGVLSVLLIALCVPHRAFAHRSGCHNLHTCPSDTGSYTCGDLGYPCNGATSIDEIPAAAIHVPLAVEAIFEETFGRTPQDRESLYWKSRFRSDKDSVYKLRRAMAWHKTQGSFGPAPIAGRELGTLVSRINALFRSVHDGRNPTVSENRYWASRISDKPSEAALVGAMTWHKLNNIHH